MKTWQLAPFNKSERDKSFQEEIRLLEIMIAESCVFTVSQDSRKEITRLLAFLIWRKAIERAMIRLGKKLHDVNVDNT